MNYKIIRDLELLKSFINWLPDLEKDEKFYCCLLGRRKLQPNLKSDKSQLKRFLVTKENLIQKIRQLECPLGSYFSGDVVVNQEALVLYINPNPRSMLKATQQTLKRGLDLLINGNKGYNIHAEAMSCIQRSKSRTFFIDFDIDDLLFNLEKLKDCINPEAYSVLRTRGGFHILVEPKKIVDKFQKTWHNSLSKFGVDQVGDLLIPAPGCTQGDFVPHFISRSY